MITVRLARLFLHDRRAVRRLLLPTGAIALVAAASLAVTSVDQAFAAQHGTEAVTYQTLAVVATVLMIFPLAALLESALGVFVRDREGRLATLRLLGASSRQIRGLARIEVGVSAVAGALTGAVIWIASRPAVQAVRLHGREFGTSIDVSVITFVVVCGAVVLATVLLGEPGLRRVLASPLGVRTHQQPGRFPLSGLVAAACVVPVLVIVATQTSRLEALVGSSAISLLPVLLTMVLGRASGPAAIAAWARFRVQRARSAQELVACRVALDSPIAVWRRVSGLAPTGVVALVGGVGSAVSSLLDGVATAQTLAVDIRTGVAGVVALTFVLGGCAVLTSEAGELMDARARISGMARIGTPASVLQRARLRVLTTPLIIATVGSATVAAVVGLPLVAVVLLVHPVSLVGVALALVGGVLIVLVVLWATQPLMTGWAADG